MIVDRWQMGRHSQLATDQALDFSPKSFIWSNCLKSGWRSAGEAFLSTAFLNFLKRPSNCLACSKSWADSSPAYSTVDSLMDWVRAVAASGKRSDMIAVARSSGVLGFASSTSPLLGFCTFFGADTCQI